MILDVVKLPEQTWNTVRTNQQPNLVKKKNVVEDTFNAAKCLTKKKVIILRDNTRTMQH